MNLVFRSLLSAMTAFLLSACREEQRKLDDTVFLDAPELLAEVAEGTVYVNGVKAKNAEPKVAA